MGALGRNLPDDWADADLLAERAYLDWLTAPDDLACIEAEAERAERQRPDPQGGAGRQA